jgi:hypothetical protein
MPPVPPFGVYLYQETGETMNRLKQCMAIAVAAGGFWMLPERAGAAEPVMDSKALEAMSKKASSPEAHAKVARQFRLRAEELDAKAEKHEQNAKKLRNAQNPMSAKWPAMARNSSDRETQLAVQARRAAQECYAQASRHINLAVEGQLADRRQDSRDSVE